MLQGKKILIGVTGSIAAYKIASLVRLLVKANSEVKIIMSEDAKEFITPLTLSTLSKNPVYTSFQVKDTGEWSNHVELGLWADLLLIAPATANTLSKMANGHCDNMLMATYLSAKCPVMFAPAMDLDMYKHESTKQNIEKLVSFGNVMIKPGVGELASGLEGEGRMAEPEEVFEIIEEFFSAGKPLKGRKIIVTAGPTYEPIDPVRFIGNHSSGKMGFAIADIAAQLGAEVTLITGPTNHKNLEKVERINVVSADDMYEATNKAFTNCDVAILSAAVADYKPKNIAVQKIKKDKAGKSIELEPTVDILASLGKIKREGQLLVGFALETENEVENAKLKLKKKNLDFIVLNSLNDKNAGFGYDTNKITIIDHNNSKEYPLKSKSEVAKDILDEIIKRLNA